MIMSRKLNPPWIIIYYYFYIICFICNNNTTCIEPVYEVRIMIVILYHLQHQKGLKKSHT